MAGASFTSCEIFSRAVMPRDEVGGARLEGEAGVEIARTVAASGPPVRLRPRPADGRGRDQAGETHETRGSCGGEHAGDYVFDLARCQSGFPRRFDTCGDARPARPPGPVYRAARILLLGPAIAVALADPVRMDGANLGFSFKEVAAQSGLTAVTVFGGKDANRYLLETTGTGVALFDYDGDGRLDVFLVNGTTLEGFPKGQEPTNQLYRNRGDGTFEDMTARVRAGRERLGPGRVRRRLRQRRTRGPVRHVLRPEPALSQQRRRHVRGRHRARGPPRPGKRTARWGTGCAFLDYDRDGKLDLLAANYIDLDLATAPTPDSGLCRYKGVKVACGPPGPAPGARTSSSAIAATARSRTSRTSPGSRRPAAPTAWA